jgi:hypothetical protein
VQSSAIGARRWGGRPDALACRRGFLSAARPLEREDLRPLPLAHPRGEVGRQARRVTLSHRRVRYGLNSRYDAALR